MSLRLHRLLIVAIFAVSQIGVTGHAAPLPRISEDQVSPKGTFKVVLHTHEPKGAPADTDIIDVWLEGLDAVFPTQRLASYQLATPKLLISEDDLFIAVNHRVGSSLSEMHVFARGKGGLFVECKKDYWKANLPELVAQRKVSKLSDIDHRYCSAIRWSSDGVLLAELGGHGGEIMIGEWPFIYDVKKDQFSWDRSKIEAIATHGEH